MRAGDVAGVGIRCLGVLEQRPHARPHAQRARLAEARDELLAVVEHRVDLVLEDRVIVGVLRVHIGRPDHADGPDRHDDVAVGRHLAAVDHRVDEPVVHRDHDPPPREDPDALDAGHLGDLARPRPGGVDGHPRLDFSLLPRARVAHARTRDLIAVTRDPHDRVVGHHLRAAHPGPVCERPDELPDLHVPVGDARMRARSRGAAAAPGAAPRRE